MMRWALLLSALLCGGCAGGLFGSTPAPVPGLRIEGNKQVDGDDLVDVSRTYLEAFQKNERRPADADDAAFAMESHLRGQGFPEAKVRFEVEPGGLVFRVDEGPLAKVGKVRFEGVKQAQEADLQKFFEFEGSGFLWLGTPLLDPAKVASAVSSVEDYYMERGYRRVDVDEPVLDWNAARTLADIVVRIEEGPQYTVRAVLLAGLERSYLQGERLEGKPYRQGLPFQLAGRVRRQLRDEGYAFATVKGTADIDDEATQVTVKIEVERGEKMRLRSIDVTGNRQTRTGFIRSRFELPPGAVLQRHILERGVADLYRSRLFSRVTAVPKKVDGDLVDLEVQVEEAKTKWLDLEVGWNSWEQLKGAVKYKDFNLFGVGRVLRASALASMKSYGGEIQVEDPWVLGQDSRLWATIGALYREDRFYDLTAYRAEVAFEHRFDREHRIWGGYRFQIDESTNVKTDVPPEVQEEIDGFQRTAGLFLLGRVDKRDDLFLPTKGWIAEGGVFWSEPVLGATLTYVELEARATYYQPFGDWGVLAVGGFAGTRHPWNDTLLPIQTRYFLGGQQSVRSFGQDQLTPTDAYGNGVGGLTVLEGHVEWRQKLYDVFYGALFYDVGFIAVDSFSLDGGVGHGLGAGLRLYTPVGPVRLDFAWNPGEMFAASRRWQVHFSFGFSF